MLLAFRIVFLGGIFLNLQKRKIKFMTMFLMWSAVTLRVTPLFCIFYNTDSHFLAGVRNVLLRAG